MIKNRNNQKIKQKVYYQNHIKIINKNNPIKILFKTKIKISFLILLWKKLNKANKQIQVKKTLNKFSLKIIKINKIYHNKNKLKLKRYKKLIKK